MSMDEISKLKEIFDGYIYSVIKYGFGKRNLLVVVKNMDIDSLLAIKPHILRLRRNNRSVLVLAYDDLHKKNLGIDFLNIQLTSAIIYGKDIFKEFIVDNARIKRHIAYEANRLMIALKNELLSLRWSWQVKSLLFSTIPRVLPLIIAHLYLKGEKIPNAIPDTINRYVKYNEDAHVLLRISKQVSKKEIDVLFKGIFEFLEHLSTHVNGTLKNESEK